MLKITLTLASLAFSLYVISITIIGIMMNILMTRKIIIQVIRII